MQHALTVSRPTRRQFLLAGGTATAAFALTAADWQTRLAAHAGFPSLGAPGEPAFVSRPDLRIPALTVTAAAAGLYGGLILLAPYNGPHKAQAGAIIVDPAGNAVWEQPLERLVTTDFRVQRYRGAPVLTWWQGTIELGHGVGSYVIADDGYAPLARVSAGNGLRGDLHEFLLTDRGTALLTSYVVTHRDLREVGGPADGQIEDAIFQEIDVASGRVLLEWHSLDHIAVGESYWPLTGDVWDYVHLNSIAVDHDQNLLVSSRNTHTVYKIERSTGAIIWRLGGKQSNFALAGDADFAWQHDARRQPDGSLTLFDNGDRVSRALTLAVNERRRTVTLARAYTHPSNLHASSQGNMQVLPNGNVFVGWGAQPYISEFAADGTLLFDARLGTEYISYRAYRMPWEGRATGVPAVAIHPAGRGHTAYVSWNGDTRVTRWVALAGIADRALLPVASTRRAGFETALAVPPGARRLRVAGVDARGTRIVTSDLLAI